MKRSAWLLLLCFSSISARCQLQQNASKQLRLYEDDDFFNVWGQGTDRAYSNGTAIGYLYLKKKKIISSIAGCWPGLAEKSFHHWDGLRHSFWYQPLPGRIHTENTHRVDERNRKAFG